MNKKTVKINVSLKKAIKIVESDLKNLLLEFDENEEYLKSLPKKYLERYLMSITAQELALFCMRDVLKKKDMKELGV